MSEHIGQPICSFLEMGYVEVSMSDMNNMVFDASSMKSVNVPVEKLGELILDVELEPAPAPVRLNTT